MNLKGLSSLIHHPQWQNHVFLWRPNSEKPLLALGVKDFKMHGYHILDDSSLKGKWWMGYISYDFKDELEEGLCANQNEFELAHWKFFSPELLLQWDKDQWVEVLNDSGLDWRPFLSMEMGSFVSREKIHWSGRMNAETYRQAVETLKKEIRLGNVYEVNYTHAFEAHCEHFDSFHYFVELNEATQAPYAAFARFGKIAVCCASPEQFLQRSKNKVYSSPIKGTARRGTTEKDDERIKQELLYDEKERAENVMIVDLVRNDFSKFASPGSVKVEELFGIYSFKTVHHMISKVSAEQAFNTSLEDIIRATFPMGSMTGAPKLSAMKLAEHLEIGSRGLYSGALGVIEPNGDFEFNVVIRSVIRNEESGFMRFNVGGAITDLCDPQKEYEESLLKARAILSLA